MLPVGIGTKMLVEIQRRKALNFNELRRNISIFVPANAEVRMMLVWEQNAPRPEIITNLVRLSKGEMVGVRYNMGKTWVGGSVGFFEM